MGALTSPVSKCSKTAQLNPESAYLHAKLIYTAYMLQCYLQIIFETVVGLFISVFVKLYLMLRYFE